MVVIVVAICALQQSGDALSNPDSDILFVALIPVIVLVSMALRQRLRPHWHRLLLRAGQVIPGQSRFAAPYCLVH
jgi:hypothetical protein